MQFFENQYFHIYNQGNNRQTIFFKPKNYHFFLTKVKKHLLPFVDVLAYCLMPNHFHLLVRCKPLACIQSKVLKPSAAGVGYQQNLSNGIAVLLRSYTRAINIQEGRTGSLFRKNTKFKDGVEEGYKFTDNEDYLKICFNYIHENPVKAGIVMKKDEWRYSSYLEFQGKKRHSICNKNLVFDMGLIERVRQKSKGSLPKSSKA